MWGDQWGRVSSGETGTNNPLIEGVRGDPIRAMARIDFAFWENLLDPKVRGLQEIRNAKRPLVFI